MPFAPVPVLGTPGSLQNFQWVYNGLTFGANTAFEVVTQDILSAPAIRSGDNDRPRDLGEVAGLDLYKGRDITFALEVGANPGYSSTAAALVDLARAFASTIPTIVGASQETPLVFQLPGVELLQVACRPRKKDIPSGVEYSSGSIVNAAILLHATDPRIYSSTLQSSTVGLVPPPPGVTFPLSFPVTFGMAGATDGIVLANNAGNYETRPVMTIQGPVALPYISNDTTGQILPVNLTLRATDSLIIDFGARTVVLNSTASRRAALGPKPAWFNFPPGITQISFHSIDAAPTGGTLTVAGRSAYIL